MIHHYQSTWYSKNCLHYSPLAFKSIQNLTKGILNQELNVCDHKQNLRYVQQIFVNSFFWWHAIKLGCMKCTSFKITLSKCTLWKQRGNTDYLMLNHRELICGLPRQQLLTFTQTAHLSPSLRTAMARNIQHWWGNISQLIYKDVLADDKVLATSDA